MGISRATYYRHRETSPSEVRLTKVTDTPVSQQLRRVRKEESAVQETSVPSIKSPVESVKPESPVNYTVVTVTAQQVNGHTCLNDTVLNPDAVIGHNLGPTLDSPGIVPLDF
jgi:hypothetical protein